MLFIILHNTNPYYNILYYKQCVAFTLTHATGDTDESGEVREKEEHVSQQGAASGPSVRSACLALESGETREVEGPHSQEGATNREMEEEEASYQEKAGVIAGCDLGTPESGPKQVLLSQYPLSQHGAEKWAFNKGWFQQYQWLEYSVTSDSAFCFSCRLFGKQNIRTNKDALIGSGFSNWKQAIDTFREHEKSA